MYQQTLSYLFDRLPMFQRVGAAAYKADLHNTLVLCEILNNPEKTFPSVHIAGTNGKGSVSNITASILQEAGYKTGLFTSPHLKDFRERIRVNGAKITEDFIVDFVEKNKKNFETVGASFFEYTFAMAMQYFSEQKIDIGIIETGMGGRLDSTNVLQPIATVITNIGFDHMIFLGNTLSKIAAEKGGIIKTGIPVIIGEMQEEIVDVFMTKALEKEAPISFADNGFVARFNSENRLDATSDGVPFLSNVRFPLLGKYQERNIPTVLETITVLKRKGYKIPKKAIICGLENVVKNTEFSGRWQILGEKPLIVGDTAHNESGLAAVIQQIKSIPFDKLHMVLGVVNDKDLSLILPLFPKDAVYYFCKPDIPRGLFASILQTEAATFGLKGNAYNSVKEALTAAKNTVSANDMIFVGGSTFTVAEVL